MQEGSKVFQSPLSTLRSDSDSSFYVQESSPFKPFRRFVRSSSSSRSKSRQEHKQEISSRFFVKNVFKNPVDSPKKNEESQHRFIRLSEKITKREVTPAKKRNLIKQSKFQQDQSGHTIEKQLEFIKLERKCQLTEAQNMKLSKINKILQQKVEKLENELSSAFQQKECLRQKLQKYLKRQAKQSKGSINSLAKLKKQIANNRQVKITPAQILEQQFQTIQNQLIVMKQSLKRSENLRITAENYAAHHKSNRQTFLQDLVNQLKIDLGQKEETISKMNIQLNILKIRQTKVDQISQCSKFEQLQAVKKKYGNILKKYYEVSQELAAVKRKEERKNHLFSNFKIKSRQNSLSLSP